MQKALHTEPTAHPSVISADFLSRSSKCCFHVLITHFKESRDFKADFFLAAPQGRARQAVQGRTELPRGHRSSKHADRGLSINLQKWPSSSLLCGSERPFGVAINLGLNTDLFSCLSKKVNSPSLIPFACPAKWISNVLASFLTKSLLWLINFKANWLHMLLGECCFH